VGVELEHAERVGDEPAAVALYRLHGMGVVPEDQGGACIDESVGEADLPWRGVAGHLRPPVQRDRDVVAPACKGLDIAEDLLLDQRLTLASPETAILPVV